ncbi:putative tpr domain-containing protein [Phaeomoniella chlamydospora]|uniref:Putative tpr domain-containing protein n=1 Tax=Phaeomoniella chlamydospora TaxID=158046 RepID=A0A0G2DY67_PHACM|nr:putative tpr domain-containing protein [Phaeomoniella chlamydospora]
MVTDIERTLRLPLAQKVLGHHISLDEDSPPFIPGVISRIEFLLRNPENVTPLTDIGNAALNAFLQSNITGPPLSFDSAEVILPSPYKISEPTVSELRKHLLESLSIDGEAVYELTPNIELFWFAKCLHNHDTIANTVDGKKQRARTNFIHQKLLFEESDTLKRLIFADLKVVESTLFSSDISTNLKAEFLTDRAAIHTYYGLDGEARKDLASAARLRGFDFALTGLLGKRTKFQQYDLSQLVVLARSADSEANEDVPNVVSETGEIEESAKSQPKPENIALNDDTLLESISFQKANKTENFPSIMESSSLPLTLSSLDPENQPLLSPQDSVILLSIASSITNTSPADGLTREETLPYALRVLEGGSSNWQIYTQALLVRSRIEGFNSRTTERGLIQLQALVDQVTADTTASGTGSSEAPTTFLPKPKTEESAPAEERLKYIFSLSTPFRWTLEAELASRWISLGGLRSALEIYERLQMWPEVALCLAATDQEKKAIDVVRKQLFEGIGEEDFTGPELPTLPTDAPRLFCILGDLESEHAIQHYTRAWEVSKGHYARAQRSLARLYSKEKSYELAIEAYKKSLQANRTNASTWFSLGCVQLHLEDYPGAAESFTQMVRLDDSDAEGWSNLAVALLRMPTSAIPTTIITSTPPASDEEEELQTQDASDQAAKQYHNRLSARLALERALTLKSTDVRLWDNYLTVLATLPPSLTPWSRFIQAYIKLLTLRPSEANIDISILTHIIKHVTSQPFHPSSSSTSSSSGENIPSRVTVQSLLLTLLDKHITPLITTTPELWYLLSQVHRWRNRPSSALDTEEKAWRIILNRPNAFATETDFNEVITGTKRLVQAYEELGPLPKEGLGSMTATINDKEAGETQTIEEATGPPVAKDWKFKARSAVRSVTSKGKENWADSPGMDELKEIGEGLKK